MICNSRHRFIPDLNELPESQAGEGRHRCAGCAYVQGYNHGINGHLRKLNEDLLKYSQAGTGRHKDVQAAYDLGFNDGLKKYNID
jgi:hypothetical protein